MRAIIIAALLWGCGGSDDAGLLGVGSGGTAGQAGGSAGAISTGGAGSVGPGGTAGNAGSSGSPSSAGSGGQAGQPFDAGVDSGVDAAPEAAPEPEPQPEAGPEPTVEAAADGPTGKLCTAEQRFTICQAAHPTAAAKAKQAACSCGYQNCPTCSQASNCGANFCSAEPGSGSCLICLNWFVTTYPHLCSTCEPFRACLMQQHVC